MTRADVCALVAVVVVGGFGVGLAVVGVHLRLERRGQLVPVGISVVGAALGVLAVVALRRLPVGWR